MLGIPEVSAVPVWGPCQSLQMPTRLLTPAQHTRCPVLPKLLLLPEGWQQRLTGTEEGGTMAHF